MRIYRHVLISLAVVAVLVPIISCASSPPAEVESSSHIAAQTPVPRISVKEAYEKVRAGDALLVCSYVSEERCKTMLLKGALTRQQFESQLSPLSKDQEIIFYCA